MRRLSPILFPLLALASVLLGLARPAGAQDTLEEIRRSGELRIGTDATYPPFEQKVGNQLEGFDIDLGNAIARRLGAKAKWQNISFDGIFAALVRKKYDLIISDVVPTQERRKVVAFSDPYYRAGQILAVRKENNTLHSPMNLKGKLVGVQLNTTAQFALEKVGGINLRKYNSMDLALLDLTNRRLDAAAADLPAVVAMIKQGFPELKTTGKLFTDEQYCVVMRQEDDSLRRAVNAALADIRASGEYDRFYRRWLAAPGEEREARSSGLPAPLGLLARVWPVLLRGVGWTVQLTLLALLFGIPIGLIGALARLSRFRPLSLIAALYVEVIRGTPLLVQIFFIYFVLPKIGISLPEFATAIVALSVNTGAYVTEIFRAGIQSIDVGQMEAARSLGMTYGLAMRLVVLPQAFRRVLPPLTNEAIALLKDSSLVSIMGMTELTRTGQELASRFAQPMAIWPAVALLYLALTLPLTRLAYLLESRWQTPRHA
jgi:arginine/lysine/histidine/glutamine transport system substrate-binding and permease protein